MSLYFIRLMPIAWAAEVLFFMAIIARPMGLRMRFEVSSISTMKVKVMSR